MTLRIDRPMPSWRRLPERLRLLQLAALRRIEAMKADPYDVEEAVVASVIAQIGTALPSTYYADLPVEKRVERMVASWTRSVLVNERLEAENERLRNGGPLVVIGRGGSSLFGPQKVVGDLDQHGRPTLPDDWLPKRLRELGVSEDVIAELVEYVDGKTS